MGDCVWVKSNKTVHCNQFLIVITSFNKFLNKKIAMQCERLLKLTKNWYLSVKDETMAPARMIQFIKDHVVTCDICLADSDLQSEIEQITTLILPESKIPKAVRLQQEKENGYHDDIVDEKSGDEEKVEETEEEEDKYIDDDDDETLNEDLSDLN